MIRAHRDAVVALIPAGIEIYVGKVDASPTYPYVFVWSRSRPVSINLASQANVFEGSVYLTHVGVNADSAEILQERTRAALVGIVPTVADRSCWKLTVESSDPVREDRDVTIPGTNTHPVTAVDQYRVASTPA